LRVTLPSASRTLVVRIEAKLAKAKFRFNGAKKIAIMHKSTMAIVEIFCLVADIINEKNCELGILAWYQPAHLRPSMDIAI
jgi:hypothetical protein